MTLQFAIFLERSRLIRSNPMLIMVAVLRT